MPCFPTHAFLAAATWTALHALTPVAAAQLAPWPAESWSQAINLTPVEGPGTNDFYSDLSGVFWSQQTGRLWLCRNGPANSTSKVWALRENGAGGWMVDSRGGNRAEWSGFNDAEAITQADPSSDVVFIMAEGEEVIREYNLEVYGAATLIRTYQTLPFLPVNAGLGSEGLAFVPDWALHDGGFVNGAGIPYTSQRGRGGLFFVGHQNGGRVYAFDLSATDGSFAFVGAYLTGNTDTSEVTFDPTTGRLFLLHGNDVNSIEEVSLASTLVGTERRFVPLRTFDRPTGSATTANIEGMAFTSICTSGHRSLFLTVDDGGAGSLLWFRQFPCTCPGDFDGNGTSAISDIFAFISGWFAGDPRTDVTHSGTLDVGDLFGFLAAWFTGC